MNMECHRNIITTLLLLQIILIPGQTLLAESKRIEVYSLGQQYWDTQSGDTLGEIVQTLLPDDPRMQQALIRDLVALNPGVFQNNDPNRMRANARIWLPSHLTKPDSIVDHSQTNVDSFSWGNIKRPVR